MAANIKDTITFLGATNLLTGAENWSMWKTSMLRLMGIRELEGHLTGTTTLPAEITPPDPVNVAERTA